MKRTKFFLPFLAVCMIHNIEGIAQNKEEFDNLVFFVPQGLSISKSTNSVRLTDAIAGAGEDFSITINKSIFSLKKVEKNLPVFWKESLAMDGFDDSVEEPKFIKFKNSGGWECFRGGKAVSYSAQSAPEYYHLTVIKRMGVTTRIITRASNEELFIRKISLLMQLVASVDFKPQPIPGSSPKDSLRVQ
jgi:hypothetical protein